MELSHLGKRVGVAHRPSIEKAKEYQRLLSLKMPNTAAIGLVTCTRSHSIGAGLDTGAVRARIIAAEVEARVRSLTRLSFWHSALLDSLPSCRAQRRAACAASISDASCE
jgi:hypothetical protein